MSMSVSISPLLQIQPRAFKLSIVQPLHPQIRIQIERLADTRQSECDLTQRAQIPGESVKVFGTLFEFVWRVFENSKRFTAAALAMKRLRVVENCERITRRVLRQSFAEHLHVNPSVLGRVNANPQLYPSNRRFGCWRAILQFVGGFVKVAEFNPAFGGAEVRMHGVELALLAKKRKQVQAALETLPLFCCQWTGVIFLAGYRLLICCASLLAC
jgi:hypothetical protein